MRNDWKDARDKLAISLLDGVLISTVMVGLMWLMCCTLPRIGPSVRTLDRLVLSIVCVAITLLHQPYFWKYGVSVKTHGWKLELVHGVGGNIIFLAPFAAWFFLI